MIRLVFNKMFYTITGETKYFRLVGRKSIVNLPDIQIKINNAANMVDNLAPSTSYKDLVNVFETLYDEAETRLIEISLDDEGNFFIFSYNPFQNDTAQIVKFLLKYHPENEEIANLTKKIFNLETKNRTTLLVEDKNNFLPVNYLVLDIIYSYHEILQRNEVPFSKFKITSKNGKVRDIIAPHELIKGPLRKLNTVLQALYDKKNKIQVGYKLGKSVKTGAEIHKNNKYVFNMDIKDFYPSCKREIVEKYLDFLFRYSISRNFLKEEFYNIIFDNDALFIGSPISGTLANVVISDSMNYLNNMCKKTEIALSVYADDISFSSDKFKLKKEFVTEIFKESLRKFNLDNYFKINEKKSVGYTGCRRKITGVSINDKNQCTTSRKYYRELRVLLNKLAKGEDINVKKLRGKIAYATMIDDSGKILRYLKKYETVVKANKLYSGEL